MSATIVVPLNGFRILDSGPFPSPVCWRAEAAGRSRWLRSESRVATCPVLVVRLGDLTHG